MPLTLNQLEAEALELPLQERIRLAQDLWESILPAAEADPNLLPLSAEQLQELERRLAEHEHDPSTAVPWEEAGARLRARFG